MEVVKQPQPVKQTEKPIDISFEKELDNHNDNDFKKHSMKELSNSNNKSIDKMYEILYLKYILYLVWLNIRNPSFIFSHYLSRNKSLSNLNLHE